MMWFRLLLFFILSSCAKAQGPVRLDVGKTRWISATCVHVPVTIMIDGGRTIYGPHSTESIPTEIRASGQNILEVRTHWPKDRDGKEPLLFKGSVRAILEIDLSGRGGSDLNIEVSGLACSNVCEPFSLKSKFYIRADSPKGTWIKMLLFAFLGGLVLNIMPCVLPVLGLKIKGLMRSNPKTFRRMCRLTILGIFSGFWALSVFMVLLKSLFGLNAGWGSHLLQSPLFSSIMAMIMMGGSYGLWGFFQINPPRWATRMASSDRSEAFSDFVSGFLAVLLATPCSAPFLGASVGFALTGSAFEIILFYTAIALGFSFPYVVAMVFPLERALPKPGPWMASVEKVMGFLFVVSSAWLTWTLSGFLDPKWVGGVWAVWCAMAIWPFAIRFVCFLKSPLVFYGIPCFLAAAFVLFPLVKKQSEYASVSLRDGHIQWGILTRDRLDQALQKGKIVFVDVTGRGCALCLFNKRLYKKSEMQDLLTSPDIVCLRGDFGADESYILSFLRKYGRSAIPFNMLISQFHPKGVVLPEYLTDSSIREGVRFLRSMHGIL